MESRTRKAPVSRFTYRTNLQKYAIDISYEQFLHNRNINRQHGIHTSINATGFATTAVLQILPSQYCTSNMTGCHRGPKKLRTGAACANAFVCRYVVPPGECFYNILYYVVFIIKYGTVHFLCTMRVFEVWASSSSPRLPFCQILFLSRPRFLRKANGEKSCTQSTNQSITQSPTLFGAMGTEASVLEIF